MNDAQLNIDELPPNMREICELIGLDALIQLAKRYGGTRLFIPKCYNDMHELNTIVGHKNCVALVQHYGGAYFYIAKLERALRHVRNKQIVHQHDGGKSTKQLAMEHNLSERQITTIVNDPNLLDSTEHPQQSLF